MFEGVGSSAPETDITALEALEAVGTVAVYTALVLFTIISMRALIDLSQPGALRDWRHKQQTRPKEGRMHVKDGKIHFRVD